MVLADREPGAPVPPGTRTGDEKAPAKPANPSASADKDAEPLAQSDLSEELPLDGDDDDIDAQPEADQVVTAKPAATQPSTPATATASTDKPASTSPAVADKKQPQDKPVFTEKKSSDDGAPKVTVTELPVEEVKPDAPTVDDNK
jgi:hypothetical protein